MSEIIRIMMKLDRKYSSNVLKLSAHTAQQMSSSENQIDVIN